MTKIGVLGLWHLGCVYSASLADKGLEVIGFDVEKSVVVDLQKGTPPIFELGLEELIKKSLDKNLHFTFDPKNAISGKDYVFITLDTPVNNRDLVQMKSFYDLFNLVKRHISPNTILVVSSQVPVGTCKDLQDKLKKFGRKGSVIYFPENLRLGQAIHTFLKPDRIVLGVDDNKISKKFLKDFNFFECPTLEMSLESAEMAKHSLNSYLATMISFCSEISDFCELIGADAQDVMNALKTDARVSPSAPLAPGIGFAGGTLGRDLQTLKMIAKENNYVPKITRAAYIVNQDRLPKLISKMKKKLGTIKNKKIGLLGLTYKPGTNTLRRSQSIEFAKMLNMQGARVYAIDPAIAKNGIQNKTLTICQKYEDFFKGLDTVILMTGWEEFKSLNPKKYSKLVKKKLIIDARNFLDKTLWEEAGFQYIGIGDGTLKD